MTHRRFTDLARRSGAFARELWLWLGTLSPAAVVAFGSFAPRNAGDERHR